MSKKKATLYRYFDPTSLGTVRQTTAAKIVERYQDIDQNIDVLLFNLSDEQLYRYTNFFHKEPTLALNVK